MNMRILILTTVISLLTFSIQCGKSIQNKKDLAQADSETKTHTGERLAEIEEVAHGGVSGLETKAVQVIAETDGKPARDSLLRLAEEKNEEVRKASLVALGHRKEPGTGGMLLEKLKKRDKVDGEGLIALGELKEEKAVSFLKKKSDEPKLTKPAVEGLAMVGTPEATTFIIDIAKDKKDADRQEVAIHALVHANQPVVKESLKEVMLDKTQNPAARLASIDTLAQLGDESTAKTMESMYAQEEGNLPVKMALIQAISKLKGVSPEVYMASVRETIWKKDFEKMKKKPRRRYFKPDGLSLKDRAIKRVGKSAAYRMDAKLKSYSRSDGGKANFIYQAYQEIYPNKDYFAIKKQVGRGLGNSAGMRAILRKISKDYPTNGLRIQAIKSYLGLNTAEARKLFRLWRAGKI